MTPQELLTRVLEAGGKVIPDTACPRLLVPSSLKPLVAEHRAALRQLVLYRETLRRWWTLIAQGPCADWDDLDGTYQNLLRLFDEVGVPSGLELARKGAREWHKETGVCPWCGELGPYHDPERGGEVA